MDFEACVTFANERVFCSMATDDADQPRVRMFSLWFADKTGFYLATDTRKAVYHHLSANPNVELCFHAPPARVVFGQGSSVDLGTMMRVTGAAELLDDPALKERLLNEWPFLRPRAEYIAVFRIPHGEAWFWTWKDDARESEVERIHF